ncbi:MAG: hypothetical protein AVDCRST_MAG85-866 [uncultured Solirubrobacteraceae bacterium]|uniref:Uncharacterized protein n=1 Tax=uncultured Solirubrobacteraceae bacterium TaxID=1162706 RepID=A0A6J4RXP0_9ACTN|nr:MAG: hypothetical protein AVDCRST_MAG85-866 [uncultured Solirubrobacteraceae bacterium]
MGALIVAPLLVVGAARSHRPSSARHRVARAAGGPGERAPGSVEDPPRHDRPRPAPAGGPAHGRAGRRAPPVDRAEAAPLNPATSPDVAGATARSG